QREWRVAFLQTYCPAGAGRMARCVSTNILPRWGRANGVAFLQTYCPGGAEGMARCVSTNILPRWGRANGALRFYKHTAPLGQGDWHNAIARRDCARQIEE